MDDVGLKPTNLDQSLNGLKGNKNRGAENTF